ncbi:putative CBL-interacting protein kinase 3 [Blattamonas nauphoetae]|uniref:CBL-interacting protein kinase 3 n=1 Tax=Blattamonas nauphoetae TaxID=2049346 RepID=A0ABQ9Y948_9EUKA|nr:putative CBL-interacting protein kinase 3 [Blattamonas nauphoetae]
MANVIEVPDGYSFVKPISSGGFGSVVEMMENSTQEHYAGKMIPCVTPKDTERIDREVNRLRRFSHPGVVKLKEVSTMDNMKVIMMELGRQSLAEIVKDYTSRKALMPRDAVYRVMVDITSALAMMHSEEGGRTAHGDVKLENILLFSGGAFKLCDLGAAESEDLNSTRSVMSQLYVSPERIESDTGKATCSSDVWALGIVLHWLLFGEPPFKSQNTARLFREIGLFQVSMIGESCGGEERALLMRMLDPNPETRVTSSQLCSFGMFRCIENTTSALWILKDADEKTLPDAMKNVLEMEAELRTLKEKLAKSESKRKEAQARVKRLEQQLNHIPTLPAKPSPQSAQRESPQQLPQTQHSGLPFNSAVPSRLFAIPELVSRAFCLRARTSTYISVSGCHGEVSVLVGYPQNATAATHFLNSFASASDEPSKNFVQSIVVLISSPSQAITAAAMKLLKSLSIWCSAKDLLSLVKATLIPQVITTLNPQSLPWTEGKNMHINLMTLIRNSTCLATPGVALKLKVDGKRIDKNELQSKESVKNKFNSDDDEEALFNVRPSSIPTTASDTKTMGKKKLKKAATRRHHFGTHVPFDSDDESGSDEEKVKEEMDMDKE